jgi:lipoprotein-anchoring transpeptidase ErfK/SrfK
MERRGAPTMSGLHLKVETAAQRLTLYVGDSAERIYAISTSRFGTGERRGSFMTPRGRHVIRAKIGSGQPLGAVLVARRPTGEIYSESLARAFPARDWVLTRILWLSGTEIGRNRLGDVDTMRRYVYIHGAPDSVPMGIPGSMGCIRMRNIDVIELFDAVSPGTAVVIS